MVAALSGPFINLTVNGQLQGLITGFTIVKVGAELNHGVAPSDIGLGDTIQIIAGGATVTAAVLVVATGTAVSAPLIALLGLTAATAQLAANQNNYTIGDLVNSAYNLARSWQAPRDPLVLDLDGDGIEATAIDPNAPILFDHDADNILTATGWIRADDGIVVLDRDGNGLIDSGRELFGDNTILTNGPRAGETAANGYEALADVDNNANGVISSQDAIYTQLRIWQDANQDGVSQATELRTLAEVGIASISTVGQATTINLGNGNTQPFSSSFTRTNGTAGTSGTAELSGSLLLAANNFYREFTDDPVVTAATASRANFSTFSQY